jgi:antitoxin component of MazEF toxin-antitoxin module
MAFMKKKFSVIGNSVGIILDKNILELHGFDREGEVEISPTEGGLLLRPAVPSSKRADDGAVKAAREKIKKRYSKTFKGLA